MLPKVPAPTSPFQFRGIMLLGVLVRRVHALLRPPLMEHAALHKPPGQLGGFAHQECCFGSLYIQSFLRRAYKAGLPVAIIFVDLSAAFHSVIREIVLGSSLGGEADRQILYDALWKEGFDEKGVASLLNQQGMMEDSAFTRLLRELRSRTWAVIHGQGVRTTRGTRPGSPIADAMFHCLMGPIVQRLEDHIGQRNQQKIAREQPASDGAQIVWADDLAIPVLATSNDDLAIVGPADFCDCGGGLCEQRYEAEYVTGQD